MVEDEIRRLREAVESVAGALAELGQRVLQRAGPEESRIFDAQIEMAAGGRFPGGGRGSSSQTEPILSTETAYETETHRDPQTCGRTHQSAQLRDRLADLHAIQMRMLQPVARR